jgi:hypothetical protein
MPIGSKHGCTGSSRTSATPSPGVEHVGPPRSGCCPLPIRSIWGGILTVNDRDQLEHAFRRLTLEHRSVLVFHHYLGLPLPELAGRLGIPLGTAKSRLRHATAALRASLDADDRTTIEERFA